MARDDEDPSLEEDPPADDEEVDDKERRRRRLERILPKVLKRAIEKGLEGGFETLLTSSDALRGVVGDNAKLPKELVGYVFSQVDDTKNAMVRVVAHEIRDFLEATDVSKELQKALTSLSFEVRTEIRFIPNDSGGIKPEVVAKVDPGKSKRAKAKKAKADEEE